MNSKMLAFGFSAMALLSAATALAGPADNVSSRRHPNIAEAQRLVSEAYNRVTAAQQANEYDLNGHAAKAKELLEQANAELKLAAETANVR